MDPMDHPADGGHNDGFNPGRASGDAGTRGTMGRGASLSDMSDRGAKRMGPSEQPMPTQSYGDLPRGAYDQ